MRLALIAIAAFIIAVLIGVRAGKWFRKRSIS